MIAKIKIALIGPPLSTTKMAEKRLNKVRALAAFSPDALSSIAYANQEIYLGLIVAGSAGLSMALPIGLGISLLLSIVAVSYYQTIQAYPSGGGSYTVARNNLGDLPGLVAASALLVDYLLTAAVSLTAAVDAISSAVPVLWDHRVPLALFLLALITFVNLRGTRETGTLLAVPVYLFLGTFILMLIFGVANVLSGRVSPAPIAMPQPAQALTLILVLHTFATGCTALTGIEAISNGVPAFQPPETRNAGRTLLVMALLMGVLFVGSIGLTQILGVVSGPDETILSALAHRLLGNSAGYYLIQAATMLILAVAANTSFSGFPRLAAVLAGDGFLPRQLTNMGDRLVFNNGILLLSGGTALLIILFNGNTHALIPLFAIGAFLAYTLSQTGMVVHWLRDRSKYWWFKTLVNGVGALATGAALVIIAISKFLGGAWITILLIPLIVWALLSVQGHYREVIKELSLNGLPPSLRPVPPPRVVVPVSGINRSVIEAMTYAISISNHVNAVYVELEPGSGEKVRRDWKCWFPDVELVVVPSPYRSIIEPFMEYLDRTDQEHNDGQLAAVILPEFVTRSWWQGLLHNQTAALMRNALLYHRRSLGFQRVIIDVPYHIRK
jgi:amino acid transporter